MRYQPCNSVCKRNVLLFNSSHLTVTDETLLNGAFVSSRINSLQGFVAHTLIFHLINGMLSYHKRNWPSRINPKLSGYSLLNGEFNYNHTPLASPGTWVIVHKHPSIRASWTSHRIHWWYIGPSRLHYRCYKCYIPTTNPPRDSNTVSFFPYNFPTLRTFSADATTNVAFDLITTLQNSSLASPVDISNPSYVHSIN